MEGAFFSLVKDYHPGLTCSILFNVQFVLFSTFFGLVLAAKS